MLSFFTFSRTQADMMRSGICCDGATPLFPAFLMHAFRLSHLSLGETRTPVLGLGLNKEAGVEADRETFPHASESSSMLNL